MSIIENKIINSIIFYASKSPKGKINRLKLMKLLWLADRIHLNKFGRLILKDDYNALPHGPVPSKAMDFSKTSINEAFDVEGFIITAKNNFDPNYFSKSDIEVMEIVWNKYGSMDKFRLRDFSHNFPEWLRYKSELENDFLPNSYEIIIDDFFNSPQNNVDYIHDPDESNNSKVVFHTHSSIQSYLSK